MKIKQRTFRYIKNYKQLTQSYFVPLESTLTYKTVNLKNLRNCLESNQCIDDNRRNYKNQHAHHDLPKTCGGDRIHLYVLDTAHRQFAITPENKIQDQGRLIQ